MNKPSMPDWRVTVRPRVVLAVLTTTLSVSGATLAGARFVVHTGDRISASVADSTFRRHLLEDSLHHRFQDSAIARIARSLDSSTAQYTGLTCQIYHYPRPFCDTQRAAAVQAGRVRP